METHETDIIGAVKIKDGLFIGDELAAQDLEFVVTNKVSHIINCAGRQIPNHWESIGVQYFTLNWLETDQQILFDTKDEILNNMFQFIETANAKGESVLVHSLKGQNRSCCILAAYLMKKYRWTLFKSLEFLHHRKPNLEIRTNFFNQLTALENRLAKQGQGAKTHTWNEIGDDPKNIESEELLLTNTFLNTRTPAPNEFPERNNSPKRETQTRVNFSEQIHVQHHPKEKKFINIFNGGDPNNIGTCTDDPQPKKTSIKSILKGSGKIFQLRPENEKQGSNDNADSLRSTSVNKASDDNNGEAVRQKAPVKFKISGSKTAPTTTKNPQPGSLDSISDGLTNIQGNIIHITVNNFISSSDTNTERAKLGQSISHPELPLHKNNGKDPEEQRFGKRGSSPGSTSSMHDKRAIFKNSKGFHVEASMKASSSGNVERLDENGTPLARNNRFRVVNVTNKMPLVVYGNQNLSKTLEQAVERKNGSKANQFMSSTLKFEKELSITGSNGLSSKSSNQLDSQTPTYLKYLNNSQGGAVKPLQSFKSKEQLQTENRMYSTLQSFPARLDKQASQSNLDQKVPLTMKNSPYFTSDSQNRRSRAIDSAKGPRNSSIQPTKENPESQSSATGPLSQKLRSSSSQPKPLFFNYFQEFSNKPRWKY